MMFFFDLLQNDYVHSVVTNLEMNQTFYKNDAIIINLNFLILMIRINNFSITVRF